ncbi:MAG: hypothetical protein WC547_09605 [Candidatus Omnitrophota bacterium]
MTAYLVGGVLIGFSIVFVMTSRDSIHEFVLGLIVGAGGVCMILNQVFHGVR